MDRLNSVDPAPLPGLTQVKEPDLPFLDALHALDCDWEDPAFADGGRLTHVNVRRPCIHRLG
jgi:hypothetical protein